MPGKPLDDPNKTRDQETADKKKAFLAYFRAWPVKKAAAEAVNRSPDAIDHWLRDDPKFAEAYLSARAEWAQKQSIKLDPTNLLTNMYPEDLKPPRQEVAVTTIEGQSAEDLLAEARALGLDTSTYEPLLTGNSTPGTPAQGSTQEGT
jgi:ferric-dicitrate binding protein FerR (iron transport regulator)